MRRVALLVMVGSCLALAGCASGLAECRKAYPPGSAAFETCRRAVLQRQNEELNRQDIREFRARD